MTLWPRSLLGQVLLAVAGALLVAQAISAALLYRASEERRAQHVVGTLAVQITAASTGAPAERVVRRWRERGGLGNGGARRMRVERGATPPALPSDRQETAIAAALREVLADQGVQGADRLRVASREALTDPRVLRRLEEGRPVGGGMDLGRARVVLASLPLRDGEWLTARTLAPERDRRALQGLALQTLVLFAVLMLAIWLLLRRITRPLAALTGRVEQFARTQDPAEPLAPQGPDDIRLLIEAHGRMEARIAAMLDEKDVMLGAIGHDLKTPLAALRVRIESVEDENERARMAAGIEDIVRTLDDILSLARVGRASEPPERTDLAALAASVVEEFEDMGEAATLAEGARVVAPVQVTWAKRALRNLVSNAVRYGGSADVAVLTEGGEAVLRVTDSGPGIPENRLATITEPFVRGEASRNRETGGAGLGLTLARAIAEAHGGRLVLANRPQGGLIAELRFPA
ncbi:Sensor protein BasS [Tsuneonella dongtanensis]|uniref:histidine kinase n=1 Tax=Tsuneonella dongtanensis TaxID=692370 RepID=A0A1B2AA98_9SPHN|nr:ATP-binding protein [Tsuneonella dongtanensis]ANY19103.1 Sensor protein BasS [Tsuneonella dongtanensis]